MGQASLQNLEAEMSKSPSLMRCSEPGHRALIASVAPREPGRWDVSPKCYEIRDSKLVPVPIAPPGQVRSYSSLPACSKPTATFDWARSTQIPGEALAQIGRWARRIETAQKAVHPTPLLLPQFSYRRNWVESIEANQGIGAKQDFAV